jgi:hypothetical protein
MWLKYKDVFLKTKVQLTVRRIELSIVAAVQIHDPSVQIPTERLRLLSERRLVRTGLKCTRYIIYRVRPDDNRLIYTELSNHLGLNITSVTANIYSCQHKTEI